MNTNPYQPPNASYDHQGPGGPGESPGEVPADILEAMRQTRPWVLFLGVMGFLSVGLMVLLGLGVLAMGGVKGMPGGGALGLVYIVLGALYVVPALYLWRYGSRIGSLVQLPSMDALRDALVLQKSFWRFIGITVVVVMVVYFLMILVVMVVGVTSALHKTG